MATPPTTPQPELAKTNLAQAGSDQSGWSSLSGRVLDGGFELQEMVEADETSARFRVRVLGDRELDCVARFFRLGGQEAERQAELWTVTRQLRHPHVSAPLGAGLLHMDAWSLLYCVVRRADESLDVVLAERALTHEEAGEVLVSASSALEVLHLNGLVFGCLSPLRVLAVGDAIKLPGECVRPTDAPPPITVFPAAYVAPESGSGDNLSSGQQNTTPSADVWCLGATIFEALTQKVWNEGLREETGELPEPFASIALRCLHPDPTGRASLSEVMALYRGELKPVSRARAAVAGASPVTLAPEPAVTPAAEAKTREPEVPLEPRIVEKNWERTEGSVETGGVPVEEAWTPPPAIPLMTVGPTPSVETVVPVVESQPISSSPHLVRAEPERVSARPSAFDVALENRPVRRRSASDEEEEPATSLWVWAGIMLLVVFGLIWALRPKATHVPAPVAATTAPAKGAAPATVPSAPAKGVASTPNAWQTQTLQPDGSVVKPSSPPTETSGHGVDSGSAGAAIWRVVVFTYSHREDAEKKVHALNARSTNLHATVFSPSGSGSPFLVVLGGRMSRDDAAQLRRKAVGEGLPRDSYIQNYSH